MEESGPGKLKLLNCLFCGEKLTYWIEGDCGAHPSQNWYVLNHCCSVEIELLQKGGLEQEFVNQINKRANDAQNN